MGSKEHQARPEWEIKIIKHYISKNKSLLHNWDSLDEMNGVLSSGVPESLAIIL